MSLSLSLRVEQERDKDAKKGPLENSIRSRRDVSFLFFGARQFKLEVIE